MKPYLEPAVFPTDFPEPPIAMFTMVFPPEAAEFLKEIEVDCEAGADGNLRSLGYTTKGPGEQILGLWAMHTQGS